MKETLIQDIHENPCPRQKGSNRGRPPVHAKENIHNPGSSVEPRLVVAFLADCEYSSMMDFACLLIMPHNDTFRYTDMCLQEIEP